MPIFFYVIPLNLNWFMLYSNRNDLKWNMCLFKKYEKQDGRQTVELKITQFKKKKKVYESMSHVDKKPILNKGLFCFVVP